MKARRSLHFFFVLVTAVMMITLFAASAEAAVKTPAKVKGLKVTKAADTSLELSWSKAKYARKYQVNYKLSTAKKWSTVKTKSKKIKLTKLRADSKYSIKVRGINGKKNGKFSKAVAQKTFATPEKVFGKSIYAVKQSKNDIIIAWKATKNTSYYEIVCFPLNGSEMGPQTSIEASYDNVYYMKPNSWYGFKVRSVNTRTGKFPALKSAWSEVFYTCTTSGDRVITGTKDSKGVLECTMTGTTPFRIDEDNALIPTGYLDMTDEYSAWFISDRLICDAVSFPADFDPAEFAGKTFRIGDTIDGEKIERIVFELSGGEYGEEPDGLNTVTLYCENYSTHCLVF